MKKILLTIVAAAAVTLCANGQEYKTGVGLRLGSSSGFTIKHFVNRRAAIEGLLLTKWHGFDLTGLYEVQQKAFDTDHLDWYYGFGAHIGFYNGDYVEWGAAGRTYNIVGIDGILGLEYTFEDAPINIGLDLKPALNFVGYSGFWTDIAISVRYVF
jgi:hypothetical protein